MRCKYTKDFREICSALQISFIFALFLQNIAINLSSFLDNPFSDGALLAVVIDTYLI